MENKLSAKDVTKDRGIMDKYTKQQISLSLELTRKFSQERPMCDYGRRRTNSMWYEDASEIKHNVQIIRAKSPRRRDQNVPSDVVSILTTVGM